MEEKKKDRKKLSGYVFVGCLLIGLAAGQMLGRPDVGVLFGLGVGFIAMFIAMLLLKE